MEKKVKIGVLGAGRIGKLHIMNLCQSVPNAEVVAVADPYLNDETAEWCKGLGVEVTSKDPRSCFRQQGHRRGIHLLVHQHARRFHH